MSITYQDRAVDGAIAELLAGLPSLLIVGPRATGKTTTASRHASTVVQLDDPVRSGAFHADADVALQGLAEPVLLDEWQEAPQILGAVKRTLDIDSRPGRFLLTGSVNNDLEAETWPGTGRLVRVPMYGMTVAEQVGATSAFLDRVSDGRDFTLPPDPPDLRGYVELALKGGFPEVLRPEVTLLQRERWLESYVDQVVTRDARRDGSRRDPVQLRQYLEAFGLSSAGIVEDRKLHDTAGISHPTASDYQQLLRNLWVIENLPAWTSNRLKRLVRAPKRYITDSGLLAGILRLGADDFIGDGDLLGRLLDTFVASQLRAEAGWARSRPILYHLREEGGRHEVDILAELRGRTVVGMEVKASGSPSRDTAKHLIWLRDKLGARFVRGIVFHTGPRVYELDERITAAPIATLWG